MHVGHMSSFMELFRFPRANPHCQALQLALQWLRWERQYCFTLIDSAEVTSYPLLLHLSTGVQITCEIAALEGRNLGHGSNCKNFPGRQMRPCSALLSQRRPVSYIRCCAV